MDKIYENSETHYEAAVILYSGDIILHKKDHTGLIKDICELFLDKELTKKVDYKMLKSLLYRKLLISVTEEKCTMLVLPLAMAITGDSVFDKTVDKYKSMIFHTIAVSYDSPIVYVNSEAYEYASTLPKPTT